MCRHQRRRFITEAPVRVLMTSNRVSSGTAVVLAAIALTALASGASAATVQVHIAAGSFAFSPATVNINASDTVEFVNDDTMGHDVTFQDGQSSGAAGAFAPGAHWNRTFAANGTFKFRCTIHSSDFASGMVGAVQVGPAPAAPPPAKPSPGFD